MNKLGDLLLMVMFFIIMIVCTDVLISAYYNLRSTNSKIVSAIEELNVYLKTYSEKDFRRMPLNPNDYTKNLDYQSKNSLDSNTISFLFQLFTIALISAGIYLLSRSHSHLKLAEKKVELLGLITSFPPLTFSIASSISFAFHLSCTLRTVQADKYKDIMPIMRESIHELYNNIENAKKNDIGIEETQHNFFLDQIVRIKENLTFIKQKLSVPSSKNIDDLVLICDESLFTLKNYNFVNIYKSKMTLLLSKRSE